MRAAAFSPDGLTLATASNDGTLKLWDVVSGEEHATLPAYADLPMNPISENNILGSAFRLDGERLVAVGMSEVPKVWDVASGEMIKALYGHDYNVPGVAMSSDGARFATVGIEGQVIVWHGHTERNASANQPQFMAVGMLLLAPTAVSWSRPMMMAQRVCRIWMPPAMSDSVCLGGSWCGGACGCLVATAVLLPPPVQI